jgi:hypothetical protein
VLKKLIWRTHRRSSKCLAQALIAVPSFQVIAALPAALREAIRADGR